MFNLQHTLESRLATLEGNAKKQKRIKNQCIELNDTSVAYIKKSLTQAGILSKNGELLKNVKES